MVPLAVAAILIAAVGAVSINWNLGFGLHGPHGANTANAAINQSTAVGFNYRGHGAYAANVNVNQTAVLGWNYRNVTYNASAVNAMRANSLKELGTAVQCRTNFIDTAVPIASKALNISLNVSDVNSANAKLQSDITSNASTITIRSDVLVFDGSALRLFGQVVGAGQKLNQTQLQSLRAQLNSSVQTLQNCTSTAGVKGSSSARFGFGFGSIHNFLIGFGGRMRTFWRGFSAGFHAKARAG